MQVWEADRCIIAQGDTDNDLFFILIGSVVVETNGRRGPLRAAGEHFGEMALIDLHARRSASIRTLEETVVARITEPDFAGIANSYPHLWRALAVDISRRLRQRLSDVLPRNQKPSVFIGSSREAVTFAKCIRDGIADAEKREVRIWSEGVFGASETTIKSLEGVVRQTDFGVLILSPDDELRSRGRTHRTPRDNVIFELGLFMGAVGRKRTFIVRPRKDIKILTDLLGVTALTYDDDESIDLKDRMEPVCADLITAIDRAGPK